jgi:hypothetical protein
MTRLAALPVLVLGVLACGCPHGSSKRPYPEPTVDELLARIAANRDGVTSFSAESVMDYWMDDQRVKGDVLVMGTQGSMIRIHALSPAGGDVMADLACDGMNYAYTDKNKNCQLSGPCSKETIASLFKIALAPDDFVQLATGATPIVPGATGKLSWDGKNKKEVLDLTGSDGRTQRIVLDARDGHADVISSEVKSAAGVQEWRIDNTDYKSVTDEQKLARRVPGKSRFRSPGEKADLLVEWKARRLNPELTNDKFVVEIDPGVQRCQ